MTEPGHVAPASPGWWVRTNRVGVNANGYGFAVSAVGSRLSFGAAAGTYGWVGTAFGKRPKPVFVGANTSTSNSVPIPTHQVGDIIILYGFNDAIATVPTKPSAGGTVPNWVYIDNATGADNCASTTAYFVATATTTTSGLWNDCGLMIAVVLRGQKSSSPIGGHAESGGISLNGATAPTVAMSDTTGTSMLLHFFGRRAVVGFSAWSAAPAGYTNRAAIAPGPGVSVITKDSTTSDGSVTRASDGNSNIGYRGATVEILS